METALELAKSSSDVDVPVGALIVGTREELLATGYNNIAQNNDPLGHAEIQAISEACRLQGSANLEGHTLVVTLEPCLLCAGLIRRTRLSTVVYGAHSKTVETSLYDVLRDRRLGPVPEVISGVLAEQSERLLTSWFKHLRTH